MSNERVTYAETADRDIQDMGIDEAKRYVRVLAKDADRWYEALCATRMFLVLQFALWVIWL